MSEHDPRPATPQQSPGHQQLPAVSQQQMQGALGTPLPAAPWIDSHEQGEGFNFGVFLHSLRRRWLLGLGMGLLIASLFAGLLWLVVPIKYEAIVTLRVKRNPEEILRDKFKRAMHPQDYEIFKQTQAALIKSPYVIRAALREPRISQMPIVRDEPWPWMGKRDNVVGWLERELKVQFSEGSEILQLSMKERNKDDLERLLNAITDAYIEKVVAKERDERSDTLVKLRDRYRTLSAEHTNTLEQISNLAKRYGSTENDQVKLQLDMGFDRLRALDRERLTVDQAYFEAYEQLAMHQQRMHANATYEPLPFEVEDVLLMYPEYAALKTQLIELETAMKLRSGQMRNSAGMGAGMQTQVAALRSQMEQFRYEKKDEAVQRLRMMTDNDDRQQQKEMRILEARFNFARQRREAIAEQYAELREELQQMGQFSADLQVQHVELRNQQEFMGEVKQQMERLELELSTTPQIEVLQTADTPNESNWILKYMQIIAGWMIALVGTVLGVAFWDMQFKRVNNSQEVVDKGDIRVIGTLPSLVTRRAGGLLPVSETGKRKIEVGLTRSIDSIRTALLYSRSGEPLQVVMLTSALGQEGKTTVASQLAVSYARSGRRTLLIDGDLRNPQQHVVMGMKFDKGLCDLLRSDASLDDVIHETPAEGLHFVSTGYRDSNTDQMLSSAIVERIFRELRSRYDVIILDTGPVLTSPDAMLLGQYADAALISVRRDVSRLPKVTEACERLRTVGISIAGSVLNGVGMDLRESELELGNEPARKDPQLEDAAAN